MHHTNHPLATPEEIRAFIDNEYPELIDGQISIGRLGNRYRVIVKDAAQIFAHDPHPSGCLWVSPPTKRIAVSSPDSVGWSKIGPKVDLLHPK